MRNPPKPLIVSTWSVTPIAWIATILNSPLLIGVGIGLLIANGIWFYVDCNAAHNEAAHE